METINTEIKTDLPKSMLEQTNEAIAKLKAENERMENNLKEIANEKLAGTTGGNIEPEQPKEMDDKDYANAVLKGEIGNGKEE